MTFALATVACGMPQVVAALLAAVFAFRGRRRAPRAARWALAASLVELLLVVADLALLGGADLVHSLTYATEQSLAAISNLLVLLSVLALAPLLYAVQLDRSLRLPSLGRRAEPAVVIPPGTRARWEQVVPRGPEAQSAHGPTPPDAADGQSADTLTAGVTVPAGVRGPPREAAGEGRSSSEDRPGGPPWRP
jgi:hypothetical protein